MNRIGWENGNLVSKAKVIIDGIIHEVEPPQYSGKTPISAENFKKMEDNVEEAINKVGTIQTDENGTYIKFESGLLICLKSVSINVLGGNAIGSFYRTNTIDLGDFPVPFIETPYINYDIQKTSEICWIGKYNGEDFEATKTNAGRIVLFKNTNATLTGNISYIAIGKWK